MEFTDRFIILSPQEAIAIGPQLGVDTTPLKHPSEGVVVPVDQAPVVLVHAENTLAAIQERLDMGISFPDIPEHRDRIAHRDELLRRQRALQAVTVGLAAVAAEQFDLWLAPPDETTQE